MNGKYGELGSPEAIAKREADFLNATGQTSANVQREQIKSTEEIAADRIQADKDAAALLAGAPASDTGKAVREYNAGLYGPAGSAEAIKRRDDEIAFATTHKGPDTVLMQGDTTIRKKLYETMGTKILPQYMQESKIAGDSMRDMEILDQLDPWSEGPIAGNLVTAFPFLSAFDSQASAFNAIVKRVAPQQREEGSGSTSDIEYAGLLESMPQLRNNPEANDMIREAIKGRAQIALERGRIINEWQKSPNDPNAENILFDRLAALDAKSIINPRLQAMIDAIKEGKKGPQTPGMKTGIVKIEPVGG